MVRGLIMRDGRTPRRAIIGLSIASILLALSLTSCFAQRRGDESQSIRPRRALAQDSRTITVKAVEKLQAAIDRAKFGDTILLQAGAKNIPRPQRHLRQREPVGFDTAIDLSTGVEINPEKIVCIYGTDVENAHELAELGPFDLVV